MRRALIDALLDLAEIDSRVLLLTGDLGWSFIEPFIEAFPKRFLNVGVAEQNLVGVATGLALAGYIPFVYSIATFSSMRCYEQIRNGPILHQLPVRVLGIGGGFSYGHAGPTHYSLEDVAIMRTQPGMTVLCPADCNQVKLAIRETRTIPGPVYLRIGKRDGFEIPSLADQAGLDNLQIVVPGERVLIVACGEIVTEAIEAASILSSRGIAASVATLLKIPFSAPPELADQLRDFEIVVSVEEGYAVGGLGSLLAEAVAKYRLGLRLIVHGVQAGLSTYTGDQLHMRMKHELDAAAIAKSVTHAVGSLEAR